MTWLPYGAHVCLYADVQSTAPSAGPITFAPVCLEPRKAFPLETLRSRERDDEDGDDTSEPQILKPKP